MGGITGRIFPQELDGLIGVATAPVIVDARLPTDFDADDAQIVGATRRLSDQTSRWRHKRFGRPCSVLYDTLYAWCRAQEKGATGHA